MQKNIILDPPDKLKDNTKPNQLNTEFQSMDKIEELFKKWNSNMISIPFENLYAEYTNKNSESNLSYYNEFNMQKQCSYAIEELLTLKYWQDNFTKLQNWINAHNDLYYYVRNLSVEYCKHNKCISNLKIKQFRQLYSDLADYVYGNVLERKSREALNRYWQILPNDIKTMKIWVLDYRNLLALTVSYLIDYLDTPCLETGEEFPVLFLSQDQQMPNFRINNESMFNTQKFYDVWWKESERCNVPFVP